MADNLIDQELESLENPDSFERLAPLGYRFLLESSHERESSLSRIELKAAFQEQGRSLRSEANSDYMAPSAVSIPLPDEQVWFEDSLLGNLMGRASQRSFNGKPIELAQLAFLLKLSCGIKPFKAVSDDPTHRLRAPRFYPSGGALYPLRVYLDIINVEGVEPGLYLYNPLKHSLDLVNDQPINRNLAYNSNVTEDPKTRPACVLLLSAKPRISLIKYREHAWRVVLMEVGHLSQNFLLVATGLGLASYPQSSLSLRESQKVLRSSVKTEVLLQTVVLGHCR